MTILNEMCGSALNAALVNRFMDVMSPFPAGQEVLLRGRAEIDGCKGVVARTNRGAPTRPVVRVLFDQWTNPLSAYELDLSKEPDIALESTMIFAPDSISPMDPDGIENILSVTNSYARWEMARPSVC